MLVNKEKHLEARIQALQKFIGQNVNKATIPGNAARRGAERIVHL
jgi:hypothetical protein